MIKSMLTGLMYTAYIAASFTGLYLLAREIEKIVVYPLALGIAGFFIVFCYLTFQDLASMRYQRSREEAIRRLEKVQGRKRK